MQYIDMAFDSLVAMSVTCLAVLAIGTLLTWCWAQPLERLRCIQVTFVALVATCLMQQSHVLPQYSLGWLPSARSHMVAASSTSTPSDTGQPSLATEVALTGLTVEREAKGDASPVSRVMSAGIDRRSALHDPSDSMLVEPRTGARSPAVVGWLRASLVILFVAGAGCSLLYMGVGMVRLRRLRRNCAPAPVEIGELMGGIQGPRKRLVPVLSTSEIDVPLTFGVRRPAILLPASLIRQAEKSAVRDCLAHEWAHIRSGDIVWWWILQAIQPLVWIQPFYWLLRRQLRLHQDQMADHFAAGLAPDSASYAELLLDLAKARRRPRTSMALTMNDGHSNLFRRVQWLLSANRHLVATCRKRVTCVAAAVLIVLTGALGAVNLGHAETDDGPAADKATPGASTKPTAAQDRTATAEPKAMPAAAAGKSPADSGKAKPAFPASVMGEERPDGSLLYSGEIVDKTTKAPIRGATVTVRRMIVASFDNRVLEETKHPTDEHGKYSFVIPPQQLAERYLYIELDVEHPDYATKAGFGYALSMIRKNAKFNDPPFFYHVELDPGAAITGRIVGPDGKPLADVPLLAYSNVAPNDFSNDNFGSFVHAKSGADGAFRLNLTKTGPSVFWIVPESFAPRQIVSGTKRGDWRDVEMTPGVGLKGQVVDATGKPIAGVWVNVTDEKSQAEIQMPVATSLVRSAKTDSEGRFELGPVKSGQYRLTIDDYAHEIRYHSRGHDRVDIPAIFPRRKITIGETTAEPIVVRAIPHVQFEGQYVDSKGAHKNGHEIFVFGKLDGESYFGQLRATADGQIHGMLPHGLEDAQLQLMTNEHGALRIRLGKDKPLIHGREIKLGTLESDVTGIEIVRYTAPIVLLKVVDDDGKPIPKAKVAAIYESDDKNHLDHPVDGLPTSIFFEKQPGGILRTSQMLPDEKTRFVASAEGYEEAHETLSLPEEETRELTLVLKRSTAEKEKINPTTQTEKAVPGSPPNK
jgi:beta-lactamase regulating signal transducer with metallopeptidase domain